ncbi:MAG: 6-pyruvoyl trahydropterin synthase family protein [Myxococcota bacterium]
MSPTYQEHFGIRVTKEYFNFGSAHFLIFANGDREELHGHNYRASVEIDADLDSGYLVADFLIVKPLFKSVCDELDHRTMLPLRNPFLRVQADDVSVRAWHGGDEYLFPRRDVTLLDIENTSSELLARLLCSRFVARVVAALPELRLKRVLVEVQESPGQSAHCERVFTPAAPQG